MADGRMSCRGGHLFYFGSRVSKKLISFNAQGLRELAENKNGGISDATFDTTEVGLMDLCEVGAFLLRQAGVLP